MAMVGVDSGSLYSRTHTAVSTQYRRVTDGQADRHLATA